jgi:LmbE family N-acetylglucosaminyl deacetylase
MPDLEPVDESWTTALCVVAHPDDLEFGAAAAVARWTNQGKTVVYAMVTSGEAGIDGMRPEEARRVREAEQVESARIVGVEAVDFLGLPDGILEYGVALRRAICAAVRQHQPEIVITNNFRDTWGGQNLNQADHIATGKATLDAVRDAGNRWVFSEQIDAGLNPWGGVRQVWAASSPQSGHGVETTQTFDRGSSHCGRTRRTSTGWAGRTSIHRSSWKVVPDRPERGWGSMATTFEVFPMDWGD